MWMAEPRVIRFLNVTDRWFCVLLSLFFFHMDSFPSLLLIVRALGGVEVNCGRRFLVLKWVVRHGLFRFYALSTELHPLSSVVTPDWLHVVALVDAKVHKYLTVVVIEAVVQGMVVSEVRISARQLEDASANFSMFIVNDPKVVFVSLGNLFGSSNLELCGELYKVIRMDRPLMDDIGRFRWPTAGDR